MTVFIIIGVTVFIFGSLIGSFLNVVIFRIPEGEEIVTTPSHCPKCSHQLNVFDLVPIFSYLAFLGRCRYCSVEISPQYATIELFSALNFLFFYLCFPFSSIYVYGVILGSQLLFWCLMTSRGYRIPYTTQLVSLGLVPTFHLFLSQLPGKSSFFSEYAMLFADKDLALLFGLFILINGFISYFYRSQALAAIHAPLLCSLFLGLWLAIRVEILFSVLSVSLSFLLLLKNRYYKVSPVEEGLVDEQSENERSSLSYTVFLFNPYFLRFASLQAILIITLIRIRI